MNHGSSVPCNARTKMTRINLFTSLTSFMPALQITLQLTPSTQLQLTPCTQIQLTPRTQLELTLHA